MRSVLRVVEFQLAKKTYPTGDPKFSVLQAFPSGIDNSDPFLMCDHFGPTPSKGKIEDPDRFPVQWHPHRGMDILTYLVSGVGRHADSLGNRGEYTTPGMLSVAVLNMQKEAVHQLESLTWAFKFGLMFLASTRWTILVMELNIPFLTHNTS